jgi:AraC-like DNA-binding protein
MASFLDNIPQDAISMDALAADHTDAFEPGWVHRKTVPHTIVAQTLCGRYEIECEGKRGVAKANEAFLVAGERPLVITHHADPSSGKMASRWLHARWLVYGAIDVASLLDMPLILNARQAKRLGDIIAELIDLDAAGARGLWPVVRRQELGFRALGLICEVSTQRDIDLSHLRHAERLLPALDRLKRDLAAPLDVDELAGSVHLSRSRFFALFRGTTGTTPAEHLRRLRLDVACQRLRGTDLPLYAIAGEVGYADQFHFSRDFKRRMGVSPSEYWTLGAPMMV